MIEFRRVGKHRSAILTVMVCLLYQNLNLCWPLNDEGLALLKFRERVVSDPFGALSNWNVDAGVVNPCSWFGVECSDGNVVVLNLKGLCLEGTLAPDLGNLIHIKSIILRNNSFYGIIPEVIGDLKDLEVLDLGYNNFSGPLPSELGPSLAILLLDNNELLRSMSPEIHELQMISEVQVDKNQLSNLPPISSRSEKSFSCNIAGTGDAAHRRLIEHPIVYVPKRELLFTVGTQTPSPSPSSPSPSLTSESPSSSSSPSPAPFAVPNPHLTSPPTSHASPPPLSVPMPSQEENSNQNHHRALILSAEIGGALLLLVLVITILCHSNKVAVVRPWVTGLSGQLQKAFVTGVPKLKRSEVEAACEDFSNVIGSSSIGTVYKGTLSNGVEIAVTSVAVTSAKDWSNSLEAHFRNKIDSISKVNHKNFMNLLGYCEEDKPFTRMLVFEYAPNGTLYEHLHVKEAEHLDWGTRMRIIMGISYCLEHMHQLTPRVAHKNLNSSAVSLTEDYTAKVSDFGFWNSAAETESNPECNVYSFGVLLFEVVTGKALPYSADIGYSFEDCWASQPLREMVDPTLTHFRAEQVEQIGEVIKSCVRPKARQRPQMREVTAWLREITAIGPEGAAPKLSPLWWAELEIMSTEAS